MKNLKQPWLGNMRFSRIGFDALHLGPHLGIMNSCHLLQEENQRIKFVGMSSKAATASHRVRSHKHPMQLQYFSVKGASHRAKLVIPT